MPHQRIKLLRHIAVVINLNYIISLSPSCKIVVWRYQFTPPRLSIVCAPSMLKTSCSFYLLQPLSTRPGGALHSLFNYSLSTSPKSDGIIEETAFLYSIVILIIAAQLKFALQWASTIAKKILHACEMPGFETAKQTSFVSS